MSRRDALIKEMLAMQKQFIARDQAEGIDQEAYFNTAEGDDLHDYQARYNALANELRELAHADKGSAG